MVGAWYFGCCQAHQGLPVGFLLLPYSVLFTVESLSLLYLLFISWFICSRRWCIDKLGVFHANQTSMCLDPHLRVRLACHEIGLSPPVKYFTYRSYAVLLLWIIYVMCFFCGSFMLFSVLFLLCFCACLFINTLWSPAGKGLTTWLSFVMSNCKVVTFPLVSWVRCGAWLYWFLIFALFLTLRLTLASKCLIRHIIIASLITVIFRWSNHIEIIHFCRYLACFQLKVLKFSNLLNQ